MTPFCIVSCPYYSPVKSYWLLLTTTYSCSIQNPVKFQKIEFAITFEVIVVSTWFFAHGIIAWKETFVQDFITWLGPSPILWRLREKRPINQKMAKFGPNFCHEGIQNMPNLANMLNNLIFPFRNWKQNAKILSK